MPPSDFAIENAKSDVKIALRRGIAPKEFFEEVYHLWMVVRLVQTSGTRSNVKKGEA
jgi:hypothetical protein